MARNTVADALTTASRRFGYDLHRHLRGSGTRPGWRFVRVVPVGPLDDGHRRVPPTFDVPIERCTTPFGFSYAPDGWHPYVRTLTESVTEPGLDYASSTLGRLHDAFRPQSMEELFLDDSKSPQHPLDKLPPMPFQIWKLSRKDIEHNPVLRSTKRGGHYFGPIAKERGEKYFRRLLAVFESIREYGYDPRKAANPLRGYFVSEGEHYRFVVLEGNHRIAALAVLGTSTVRVRLSGHPVVIARENLSSWTTTRGGALADETAQALFDKQMHENGAGRARRLGLLEQQ